MALQKEDILKLAAMAKLDLTEEQTQKFSTELSSILSYVDLLSKANTKNVEPTIQVVDLNSVTRNDEVVSGALCTPEALLSSSQLHKEMKQIRVPKVLD